MRTDNRTDVTMLNEGALVVGGVVAPEAWATAAKAQQEEITNGD